MSKSREILNLIGESKKIDKVSYDSILQQSLYKAAMHMYNELKSKGINVHPLSIEGYLFKAADTSSDFKDLYKRHVVPENEDISLGAIPNGAIGVVTTTGFRKAPKKKLKDLK